MADRTCTIAGCDKKHRARGLCASHYNAERGYAKNKMITTQCSGCGIDIVKRDTPGRGQRWCSEACRGTHGGRPGRPPKPRGPQQLSMGFDNRSNLRQSYEEQDWRGVLEAVHHRSRQVGECREWTGRTNRGYPIMRLGKREIGVHRMVVEATLGGKLGDQPVHHECANPLCVRPEHLTPVTHRENAAEMLTRRFFERRIVALEAALAEIDPQHPLLQCIGLGLSA